MKKLLKYNLEFDPTWEFVQETLEGANTLSDELLKQVNFQMGEFFTLLPQNAHISNLHRFTNYILQQNPLIEYGEGQKKSRYQLIPTVRDEIAKFIIKQINIRKNISCVFDDVTRYSTDNFHMNLFKSHGLSFGKEVYYLVSNTAHSVNIILECLQKSNAFWHSLCVLTSANLTTETNQKLTVEKLQDVAKEAGMIIVGAYDGEGYIFWQRTKN